MFYIFIKFETCKLQIPVKTIQSAEEWLKIIFKDYKKIDYN